MKDANMQICDALRDFVPFVYSLKNVENTHGGVLILVLKVTLLHGCFSHFLNCTNGTKLRNASHVRRMVKKCGKCRIFTLFQVWKSGGNTLFPQTGKSPKTLRKLHYQKFSAKENQLKIS